MILTDFGYRLKVKLYWSLNLKDKNVNFPKTLIKPTKILDSGYLNIIRINYIIPFSNGIICCLNSENIHRGKL